MTGENLLDVSLYSVDGPNGTGKSSIVPQAVYLTDQALTLIADGPQHYSRGVESFDAQDYYPPMAGHIAEPPGFQAGETEYTWRELLKSGANMEILKELTGHDEEVRALTEGFLMYREEMEERFTNPKAWRGLTAKTEHFMLHSVAKSGNDYISRRNRATRAIWLKDRGSLSTAVFQGEDEFAAEMLREAYVSKRLRKEKRSFIILPKSDRLLQDAIDERGKHRREERDMHEGDYAFEVAKYRGLRDSWEGIISEQIIYLENDASRGRPWLSVTSLAISLMLIAEDMGEKIEFTDTEDEIRLNKSPLLWRGVTSILTEDPYLLARNVGKAINSLYGHYMGIPLAFVVGEFGLVLPDYSRNQRGYAGMEFILSKNLERKVEIAD